MSAIPRHGFDGDPPYWDPLQDHPGGQAVRQLGEWRKIDHLFWLKRRKLIEQHQYEAGTQLRADCEQAEIRGYAALGSVGGGSGTNRLSDVRCDAIARVNAARERIGNKAVGWRMLELVVIENVSLGKSEARLRLRRDSGIGMLLGALDTLASHYGLA